VVVESTESAEGLSLRRRRITGGVAPRATGDHTTQGPQAISTNGEVVFMRN
jgi:multiple sugar transport system substrate-binding protein